MKLLVLFPPEGQKANISAALLQAGYRITTISSQLNPLSRHTDILMIGLDESQVPKALEVSRHALQANASLRYLVLHVNRFDVL